MAHKLEIRARSEGQVAPAVGYDADVTLDGRPLEWTEVELILNPDEFVRVRLTLPLRELTVDADVLVALRAMADTKTKVIVEDGKDATV